MNGKNEAFRKSLSKVEQSSEEYEEKQKLEDQFRAATDKYKYKRRQIKELQEDLQSMQKTYEDLSTREQDLVQALEEKTTKSQRYGNFVRFSCLVMEEAEERLVPFCPIQISRITSCVTYMLVIEVAIGTHLPNWLAYQYKGNMKYIDMFLNDIHL